MVNLSYRFHPDVLFAYSTNHTEIILRVENNANETKWIEADVIVPEKLSLLPNQMLKKGRLRVGIVGKNEFLEKAIRIFGTVNTTPQVYHCNLILYLFNKDGIIEKRIEKGTEIRCEMKKEEAI